MPLIKQYKPKRTEFESKINSESESEIWIEISQNRITYTRHSFQFSDIRDGQPKQEVHEHKRHEQDEDQEEHLFVT